MSAGGVLTLNNITLRGGNVNSQGAGLGGGGIFNAGVTSLNESVLSDNQSGTYGGGFSNGGGTLTITDSTITGNRAVNAGGGLRNVAGTVTLVNTVLNANVSSGTGDLDRGGLANHAVNGNATMTIHGSQVMGNTANGVGGGGIDNAAHTGGTASLILVDTTVRDNVAVGADHTAGLGGGIQNSFFRQADNATAGLTVEGCTVNGNLAVNGGGISNGFDVARDLSLILNVSGSTVSGNTATGNAFQVGNGGGIYAVNGSTVVANSTVSGNTASGTGLFSGLGGGLMNAGLNGKSGDLTLISTTVSANTAATGGGALANAPFNGSASVQFTNALLAANSAPENRNCANLAGVLASLGHNLEDGDGCQFSQPTDVTNTDPLLGALSANGGLTLTHALLPGSPAIDRGDDAACEAAPVAGLDQRGVVRPQGSACDIGSYEADWAAATMSLTTVFRLNDGSSGAGRFALLTDGTFVDQDGATGTWTAQSSPPTVRIRYPAGVACEGLWVARFTTPTQLQGSISCLDGSAVQGIWRGTVADAPMSR